MEKELTTKQKGDITELKCLTYFYEQGYSVSVPWGENDRYDLILDIGSYLLRLQVKTSRKGDSPGTFTFSTATTHKNRVKVEREKYTKDDIDYFVTIYNNKCYLVSCLECNGSHKTLRYGIYKNSNPTNVNWSENYLAENIISKIKQSNQIDVIIDNNNIPDSIIYISDNDIEYKNYCIDCGKGIYKDSIRCKECENKRRTTLPPISREELKNKIRKQSFVSIGKEYSCSDNAIKKWCKKYNLPFKKMDINNYSDEEWLNI